MNKIKRKENTVKRIVYMIRNYQTESVDMIVELLVFSNGMIYEEWKTSREYA